MQIETLPKAEPRRIFIVNPVARTCPANAVESIRARFPEALLLKTGGPGDAARLAREALVESTGPNDMFIACGGDGTFREVAQVVSGRAKLGIIPLGTVNQIAAQLGIPARMNQALDLLAEPEIALVYPGECAFDDSPALHLFFIGVSAGPDADAVDLVNPFLKKTVGSLAYGIAFLGRLLKPVRPEITCTLGTEGGGRVVRASEAIALANGLYGAKFRFSRSLGPTVPGLGFIATRGGRLSVTALFLAAMVGAGSSWTREIGNSLLTLELPIKGAFQIDGDRVVAKLARIRSAVEPIRVVVPPGSVRV